MGEKVYGYGRKFRKGIQIQDQDLWYISIHYYRMLLLLGSLSPGGAKGGLMGKASQPAKREVIKHSAAIQIENNITLLQRRTWNALLYNAYDELETKEEHAIPIEKLARLVGYDSHDMGYLKEAALAMLRCIVQYNVLGKDGSSER